MKSSALHHVKLKIVKTQLLGLNLYQFWRWKKLSICESVTSQQVSWSCWFTRCQDSAFTPVSLDSKTAFTRSVDYIYFCLVPVGASWSWMRKKYIFLRTRYQKHLQNQDRKHSTIPRVVYGCCLSWPSTFDLPQRLRCPTVLATLLGPVVQQLCDTFPVFGLSFTHHLHLPQKNDETHEIDTQSHYAACRCGECRCEVKRICSHKATNHDHECRRTQRKCQKDHL